MIFDTIWKSASICFLQCFDIRSFRCPQLLMDNCDCVLTGRTDPFASLDIGHNGDDAVQPPSVAPAGDDAFDMWGQPLPLQPARPRQPSGQALDPSKLMQPYLSPQSSPRQHLQRQPQPAAPAHPAHNGLAFGGSSFSSDNILDSLTAASGAFI